MWPNFSVILSYEWFVSVTFTLYRQIGGTHRLRYQVDDILPQLFVVMVLNKHLSHWSVSSFLLSPSGLFTQLRATTSHWSYIFLKSFIAFTNFLFDSWSIRQRHQIKTLYIVGRTLFFVLKLINPVAEWISSIKLYRIEDFRCDFAGNLDSCLCTIQFIIFRKYCLHSISICVTTML